MAEFHPLVYDLALEKGGSSREIMGLGLRLGD